MRTPHLRLTFACVTVVLCCGLVWRLHAQAVHPAIHFVPLSRKPGVRLTPSTVDAFVNWIAVMPSSQIPEIQREIALAKADPQVIDAVAKRLSFRHPGSYGHQLILLSILGEFRSDHAVPALQAYLTSSDCPVNEEHTSASGAARSAPPVSGIAATTSFDACAGLKAAAINMIAYIHTPAAQSVVLQAAQAHPSRCVRLSAVNAYLYNEGDTPQALSTVRQHARPAEAKYSGIARLTRTGDAKMFAARVSRFYTEHAEEMPAKIAQVTAPTTGNHQPVKLSVTPSSGTFRKESR